MAFKKNMYIFVEKNEGKKVGSLRVEKKCPVALKKLIKEMASILETTIAQLERESEETEVIGCLSRYHERYTYAGRVSHVPILLFTFLKLDSQYTSVYNSHSK